MQTIEFHGKSKEELEKLATPELMEIRRGSFFRRTDQHDYNRAQRALQTQVIAILSQRAR